MNCYVRLINKDNWLGIKHENDLKGEAITLDWNCNGNEWSVFRYQENSNEFIKNELLNKIVLRMVADNLTKTCQGVTLLLVNEKFIKKINKSIVNDLESIGCVHCNIKEVTYKDIKEAIKYTLSNSTSCFISYSLKDIRQLFLAMTNEYKQNYIQYARSKQKQLNKIANTFFKDQPNFFTLNI